MTRNIKVVSTTNKGSLNTTKIDRVYINNKYVGYIKKVVKK